MTRSASPVRRSSPPADDVDPGPAAGRIPRHRGLIALLAGLLVLLVLAAGLAAGLLHRALTQNLDRQLRSIGDRYAALADDPTDNDHDADDSFDRMVGPTAGTLGATVVDGRLADVSVIGGTLPATASGRLIGQRPGLRTVGLAGLGEYRLLIRDDAGHREVVGLPTRPVRQAIGRLLLAEAAALVLLLGLLAGMVAHFVRRERRDGGDPAGMQALLAEASHELRTPAAVIHSYAELAERSADELPAPVDHALQRIESESARMGRMVEDLLVLSRFEGGYQPPLAEVDLTKLVLDAVDDARVTGRQERWELAAPDRPIEVIGHARWLFQAVAALLSNARAHTPPGTTIRVGLRRLAAEAELTVADDGPGIPPDILPTVFERFVRTADEQRYDGQTGVGLGLSVVRQILQAHSGSISVRSGPAGTEFVVRLPLAD